MFKCEFGQGDGQEETAREIRQLILIQDN